MNTEHNSANNSVDRILNALRDATPPPGIERRVLNILEAQSSLKSVITSEHRKHPGVSFGTRRSRAEESPHSARTATALRWTIGTVLAALTIAVLITFNTHRQTSPGLATITPPTPTLAPQTPIATVSEPVPVRHIKASTHSAKPRLLLDAPLTADNAQISHPAPPIPLTEQERLLLRYARRGRTDLAQISNESKAAKEQQDAAEFQAFFKPPITIGESE